MVALQRKFSNKVFRRLSQANYRKQTQPHTKFYSKIKCLGYITSIDGCLKLKKQCCHSATVRPPDQLCLGRWPAAELHSLILPLPLRLSLSRLLATLASAKLQSGPSLKACLLLLQRYHAPIDLQVGIDFLPVTEQKIKIPVVKMATTFVT